MVILYRSKNETQMVENKFIVKQIPYKIFGGIKFWQRREIKDILSFLKLSVNNNDELALKRIIYFTKAGIGETKIENINKTAKENNISFFEALKFETNPKIISFIKKVEEILNEIINLSISQSIEKIIEKTKYYDFLTNEYEVTDALEREQNVKELINTALVKEKEIENKYISIPDFLNEISLYISSNDTIVQGNDFVSLMTIHHAKGLEFKIVFVVGMVDGIFPNNNTDNYEEERRLAYVAITRAKEILYLCGYKEVTGYLRD
jgi:DNA helicase-2/ATP-dependent DNA helicase PcrA